MNLFLRTLILLFITLMTLSCANEKSAESSSNQETVNKLSAARVSGNIIYSGDASTLLGAEVTVRLNDVSLMDVSSVTLGEDIITDKTQFPILFSIEYDTTKLVDYGSYSVSARIEKDGKLLFINDTHIPVFDKHQTSDPNHLSLPVIKVN